MSARLAEFIWRFRYILSLLLIAGAVLFAPAVGRITIDNDLTSWFSPDDPSYQQYERFRKEFGGTRHLIVAVKAPSKERLLSDEGFSFIDRVSAEIERVETVESVNSLSTATVVDALPPTADDDGGIDVRPLIDDVAEKGAAATGRRAIEDDLLRGDLISEDGTVTALIIAFDEDRIDDVRAGVIQKIHEIVDPALPAGFEAHYNGSLEISETYNRITTENQNKFTPPILLLTLSAVYLMFRSWRKTVLTLGAIGVSVFWTLGLYLLLGLSTNVLASMIVPLVIVLAIADDVHIMQHFDQAVRDGAGPEQAFKSTITHMTPALFGASATTALGMLSLATSNVVAVRVFGVGAAIGVMADFLISIVLVPTVLAWMKQERTPPPQERWFLEPLRRVAAFSTSRARLIIAVALVLAVAAAAGVSRLRVDTNHIAFFSETHPLGSSARVIDNSLGGVYGFQIMLEGDPGSMQQPDTLRRIDAIAARLKQYPEVRKVTTVADYVKRINKELEGGTAEAAVIPDSPEKVAQELFVFSLADEGRRELERMMSSDASASQITVKLRAMSSDKLYEYVASSERFAAELAGSNIKATVTGSGKLFSDLDHYLVTSQVTSFGTAFITVFIVIFAVFRSARYGMLAIIPNLFPVLAVFGVMGWLDISLNIATVMVASVALGVVDDDTIHFISRFKREREGGATIPAAIEAATIYEGRAALTTALINSAGFAVLMMSEYRPSAWFGGLLALTMMVAFLAEVFILPATIVMLSKIFGRGGMRPATAAAAVAFVLMAAPAASAQSVSVTGNASALVDHLPNVPPIGTVSRDATELRLRVIADAQIEQRSWLRFRFAGVADGLVADRGGSARDATADALEAWVEVSGRAGDVRAGMGRLAWGRLDEVQPTDVINPIDVSRFLLEGRSDARIAVPFVRGRWLPSDALSVEGIVVPYFRPGRFDRLDENTSPFNLFTDAPLPPCPPVIGFPCPDRWGFVREDPGKTELQGGGRVSATTGRVDWSVSAWRGFVPFALVGGIEFPATLRLVHPRYTMLGADLESVTGKWAWRAEAAYFPDRPHQVDDEPRTYEGDSIEAGAGLDRRAGDFTLSATILYRRQELLAGDRSNVSIVTGFSRSFNRERNDVRVFSLVNPADRAAFARGVFSWKPMDDVALESSIGWFFGDGDDVITQFGDRDFAYVRVKYYFGR